MKPAIHYGAALIWEAVDWTTRHPVGPVHWHVEDQIGNVIGEDVSAKDLPGLLVSKGLLIQW